MRLWGAVVPGTKRTARSAMLPYNFGRFSMVNASTFEYGAAPDVCGRISRNSISVVKAAARWSPDGRGSEAGLFAS